MIEYMLSQLNILENNEEESPILKSSLMEADKIHIAHEVKRFMDEMPGGFFIYHADGNEEIIYANKALLRIFMCDTMKEFRQLTGNSFRGLVHPEDLEEVEESIRDQIDKSQYDLDYVEYRIIRKDGAIRWLEDYGHFVRSKSSGDIFYVFVGDSTEKRERLLSERAALVYQSMAKEQELQALVEQYDKELKIIRQEHLQRLEVIEGLSINYDSIFYVNLDTDKIIPYRLSSQTGNLLEANLREKKFSQCIQSYADTWVYSEDYHMFLQVISPKEIREKLSKTKTFYINYRVFNGTEMQYIQVRIVNTGNSDNVSQFVMGFQRVDKEIQYEMEKKKVVEEALSRAQSANNVKNAFLSNMSHDMRTPLNAIFGFTTLAKMESGDREAVQSYLDQIEVSSRQLLRLIDDILELSWMESAQVDLLEEQYNLQDLLQDVCNEMMPQAQEKGIVLSLNFADTKHSSVYGDRARLNQVLKYIVNNGIKYTEYGGKVTVDVTEKEVLPNNYVVYEFKISDTGIGIEKEFLKHIFEPFEREKNSTLSGIHGAGLGLTIAKNIVDRMGGTIGVHSVVGQGSQFTVILRFQTEEGVMSCSGQDKISAGKVENRRILVAEDNEINREIETELLESLGLVVDTAEDGSIAVEKISGAAPGYYSLVLMDIQMPIMDGYQATRTIRRFQDPKLASIPIVALSANAMEKDIRMAHESGMNAHVAKPFDLDNLAEVISKFIPEIQ